MKSKLPEHVEAIKAARAAGSTYAEIAQTYGVSRHAVNHLVNPEAYLLSTMRSARRRLKKLRADAAQEVA